MGPAARSTRRRPHIGQRVRRQGETDPHLPAQRDSLPRGTRRAFLPHPCQDDPRKMPETVVAKARGRTGIESDSDLIQKALANLALPDCFPDWLLSQNSMADAQRDGFPLPSATRSARTDSVLLGIRVGFLKPIKHLILDDSISEAIHANSAKQGLARFTSCVLQSGVELRDPDATPSITVRSTRDRSHPNDDGRKSKHEGHLSKRIHPYKLSSV